MYISITPLANFAYCIGLSGLLELCNIAIMCLFQYKMHCSFATLLRQVCSYVRFMNTNLSIARQDYETDTDKNIRRIRVTPSVEVNVSLQ